MARPGADPGVSRAPTGRSDEALAARAAAGDRDAFGVLIDRYHGRVYRFALVRLRCGADAADVAQETLCRAWKSIGRFDPTRCFATWVLTIARREVIGVVRTRRRKERDGARERDRLGSAADGRAPVDDVEMGDVWDVARRVLDAETFELVWLCYAEDRTPAQIARVIGSTGVAVRVRLHRARRKIEGACEEMTEDGATTGGGSYGAA
ncbi:MAG: RNA polymerase sigma factor [Phycisphaeraceae bacterium]|nr:MAG: RNA polymerase sigma factor [Phycisphaeraceae bacterium]